VAVNLLSLLAHGCNKKPVSYSYRDSYPLSSLRADYRTWNCQQLASEADLIQDALAVASEQHSEDALAHLNAETQAVKQARTLKKCNV
jgi:hypothetical protein